MYATSKLPKHRTVQENLRIYSFAEKHGLTIEHVESLLEENCVLLNELQPVLKGSINYD